MELGELIAMAFGGGGPKKKEEKDYELEWSPASVIPENDLKSGRTAYLKLKVTKGSLTGPDANAIVLGADSAFPLSAGLLADVKFSGGKLVNADGKDARVLFEVKHGLWRRFDKLEYHFATVIDQLRRQTKAPIKIKRWHVQAINTAESNPAILKIRLSEQQNFLAAFSGSADDEKESKSFDAHAAKTEDFGSWMKNTYSFVYTGHGQVFCATCGSGYEVLVVNPKTKQSYPDALFGKWTVCKKDPKHTGAISTFCVGKSYFHGKHIRDPKVVGVAPRYLVFSVACGGGFEPSLFNGFIARGTRYGVGFRKATKCVWAEDYAKSFFEKWAQTHKCDPHKIPEVFDGMQAAWHAKLRPVLFGRPKPQTPGQGPALRATGKKITGP